MQLDDNFHPLCLQWGTKTLPAKVHKHENNKLRYDVNVNKLRHKLCLAATGEFRKTLPLVCAQRCKLGYLSANEPKMWADLDELYQNCLPWLKKLRLTAIFVRRLCPICLSFLLSRWIAATFFLFFPWFTFPAGPLYLPDAELLS